MKINRTMTIETNEIQIGDRIQVGHYTATCQALPGEGLALFLLDQYLDKAMQMNEKNTNKGGYQESDLREELNSEKILKDFTGLELAPFDNGDLLRLPFYGEMFGHDDWYNSGAVEPDDCEQWPLMKDRANRVAERKGESYESGDGSRTSTSSRRRVSAMSATTVMPTPGTPRAPSASARLS